MPDDNNRFQIGEYWLSRRDNSPQWCRTWFDHTTRQTRRASLGTGDFQAAQLKLAKWVVENETLKNEKPQDMPLATILVRYYNEHASKIPSAEQAKIALLKWTEFFTEALVSDLTPPRQEQFVASLRASGLSGGYISRVLSVGRAALKRAWKRQELVSVPFIMDVAKGAPRDKRLSPAEVLALLDAAETVPHLFIFIMIALNTLSRPEAILDLTPAQVDLTHRFIELNPKGRPQTKKYRPTVPITNTLYPFLASAMDADRIVNWHGKPIDSIKKGFRTIVHRAGLSADVTPYTLRHTMATELRRRHVPQWDVSGFLGHQVSRITEIYAKWDSSYLSDAVKAIDDYFRELRQPRPAANRPAVRASSVLVPADRSSQVIEMMVGATGIEPVTPTMST